MDDAKLKKLSPAQFSVVEKIAKEAERQGVNPALAIAIAEAETGGAFTHVRGDKVLTSPAGAKGVMQIMPDTANLYNKKYGINIDPDDEDSNIMGGGYHPKRFADYLQKPTQCGSAVQRKSQGGVDFFKDIRDRPRQGNSFVAQRNSKLFFACVEEL